LSSTSRFVKKKINVRKKDKFDGVGMGTSKVNGRERSQVTLEVNVRSGRVIDWLTN
jgi:hypothetical protein